jgi:AcrR family transcriptional regulator
MPHPRTKPPEARREDLMHAAQRLFIENGVAATTIDQIAAGAAIAKGTFYLYFSSKEDVLVALRERFVQDFLAGIKAAIAERPPDDWPGKLAAWAAAGVDGYISTVALHDVVFHEPHHKPEQHAREQVGGHLTVQHLAALLQGGTSAAAWSVDDPDFTALALFHALHGTVHDVLAGSNRFSKARLRRNMQSHFFRAVGLGITQINQETEESGS